MSPVLKDKVAIAGAISATLVELLPIPVDDKLTIPLFSAGIMVLTTFYLGRL